MLFRSFAVSLLRRFVTPSRRRAFGSPAADSVKYALAGRSGLSHALLYIMFNPSRDDVRRFFIDTWRKQRSGEILTPLEAMAADWIVEHPEYHAELEDAGRSAAHDYTPDEGRTNPFLHLSMHLAISEQLSIDQPPGIRAAHEKLAARCDCAHDAQHAIMECLGETIWEAQRTNTPPDSDAYLQRILRRASRG